MILVLPKRGLSQPTIETCVVHVPLGGFPGDGGLDVRKRAVAGDGTEPEQDEDHVGDSDKRDAKRVSFPCEVECTGAGSNRLNPRISDLSATGAFIDSMMEVPAGSRMSLKFKLPSGQAVSVNAEVVHSMPHFGMGVRFIDLNDENRGAIEQVVTAGS